MTKDDQIMRTIEDIILVNVLDFKKPERAGDHCRGLAARAAQKIAQAVPLPEPDPVYDQVMAMSEEELVAELAEQGETLESNAAKMQAIFHKAKAEADMRLAIKAWLKCPAEKRPSPAALGQRISEIAAALS